jgi:voltage-gated potassium channel
VRKWLLEWWDELLMGSLAIATIWLSTLPDTPSRSRTLTLIWVVFLIEYLVRLVRSPKKTDFVRANLVDLVAILPWDLLRAVRMFRLLRLLRLLRGFEVLWRVSGTVRGVLRTNHLGAVLITTSLFVLGGGVLITRLEPDLGSVPDGLWWSIVTVSTVGYGDIAPKTVEGRALAALLMLIGIGTLGMITGSIATYFMGSHGSVNPHVQHVRRQLDDWDALSAEERRQLSQMLAALVDGSEVAEPVMRA